jgi:hypothetical protein
MKRVYEFNETFKNKLFRVNVCEFHTSLIDFIPISDIMGTLNTIFK